MDDAVRDVITRARALIADPKRWCRGVMAANTLSLVVDADDPLATRWCGTGALIAAGGRGEVFYKAKAILAAQVAREFAKQTYTPGHWHEPVPQPFRHLHEVNDRLGHEAVLRVYDAALSG